ncbi:MAG: GDSL-type esterase/lipase family protein [Verrucomicrobiota bacterium]
MGRLAKFFLFLGLLCLIQIASRAEFRILAFGDSNTWGWKPDGSGQRFSDAERWTGVLQERLGEGFIVSTDGLVARRTNLDGLDAGLVEGFFLNGAKSLPAALARHAPLNLLILFLGTNDVQAGAERSAQEVADAVGALVKLATGADSLLYSSYPAPPEVWVIVPPPLGDLRGTPLEGLFSPGIEASQQFAKAFGGLSKRAEVRIFDFESLGETPTGADGIHLTLPAHRFLGESLARALVSESVESEK